uniref:Uncharacterized protein n=1 Tax=Panagrolaimus davidi TaxID=227884 RepID=A0A914RD98_9BILA
MLHSSSTDSITINSLTAEQFDKFFHSCTKVALTKNIRNVGIVSCKYSSNVYINKITDFIEFNKPNPSMIIVPLFHSGRISLAVFFIGDKKIGYFDSLKQPPIYSLSFAKIAIEKYLNCKFTMENQDFINETINTNPIPELANFHICRIAEELCFYGRNQKFPEFDIILESQRIKKLIKLVTDINWKGEWIAPLSTNNPRRIELNDQTSGNENVRDEIAALESVVEAFDSDRNSISDNKDVNQSNINISQIKRRSQLRDVDKPGTQDIFQFIDKIPKVS